VTAIHGAETALDHCSSRAENVLSSLTPVSNANESPKTGASTPLASSFDRADLIGGAVLRGFGGHATALRSLGKERPPQDFSDREHYRQRYPDECQRHEDFVGASSAS